MAVRKKAVRRVRRGEWKRGSTRDFLEVDEAGVALVAIRTTLAKVIRLRRKESRLTQVELAQLAGTTQSRVAKAEAANQEISLDLCVRLLLALGSGHQAIARALATV